MRFTRTITLLIAGLISGLASAADTTDERVYHAPDGSILKLIENGLIEYESWSGGHKCSFIGKPANGQTGPVNGMLHFILNDEPACTAKIKILDDNANRLILSTNGKCRHLWNYGSCHRNAGFKHSLESLK